MKIRMILLLITGAGLIVSAIYFLLINWGIAVVLIIAAVVLFTFNLLLKNVTNHRKNIIAVSIWIMTLIVGYQYSKRVILHIDGKPEKIYVVTGEIDEPAIHSIWKWSNHINVDTSYVVYTSSSLSQLKNIKVIDENGNKISGYGKTISIQKCFSNSSLISIQTKYFKYKSGFAENDKDWYLSAYQKSKCK